MSQLIAFYRDTSITDTLWLEVLGSQQLPCVAKSVLLGKAAIKFTSKLLLYFLIKFFCSMPYCCVCIKSEISIKVNCVKGDNSNIRADWCNKIIC